MKENSSEAEVTTVVGVLHQQQCELILIKSDQDASTEYRSETRAIQIDILRKTRTSWE